MTLRLGRLCAKLQFSSRRRGGNDYKSKDNQSNNIHSVDDFDVRYLGVGCASADDIGSIGLCY
jgi:hypothetical protein